MHAVSVSIANAQDGPALLALQLEAYESEARLYNDWTIPPLTETLEQLLAVFSHSMVLKAQEGNVLLGSVRARVVNRTVQVGRLIVAPAAQRRGIGSNLLRSVEEAYPQAQSFELFTGSLSAGNIRLYLRHGCNITREEALSNSVKLVYMRKLPEAAA